jgi:uncharacterized delta-60 repeat protein
LKLGGPAIEPSAIAVQADGKIVLGSYRLRVGESVGLARLNSDGSSDVGFSMGAGFEFASSVVAVSAIVIQPDGRIVVTGSFTAYNGVNRVCIVRLNVDGTVDQAYDPGSRLWRLNGNDGSFNHIPAAALGPAGGLFVSIVTGGGGEPLQSHVVKVRSDGEIDESFAITGTSEGLIASLAVHSDGSVIAGGSFQELGEVPRNRLARLLPTGGLDLEFHVAPPRLLVNTGIDIDQDGHILVAGWFDATPDFPRSGVARLYGRIPAEEAPQIVAQPAGASVPTGAEASFSVRVEGYPAPSHQWFFEGQPLIGETSRQLRFPSVRPMHAGNYSVLVANNAGQTRSDTVTLNVLPAPVHSGAVDGPDKCGALVWGWRH